MLSPRRTAFGLAFPIPPGKATPSPSSVRPFPSLLPQGAWARGVALGVVGALHSSGERANSGRVRRGRQGRLLPCGLGRHPQAHCGGGNLLEVLTSRVAAHASQRRFRLRGALSLRAGGVRKK